MKLAGASGSPTYGAAATRVSAERVRIEMDYTASRHTGDVVDVVQMQQASKQTASKQPLHLLCRIAMLQGQPNSLAAGIFDCPSPR